MILSAATQEILQLVERKTDRRVELLADASIPVLAKAKMASEALPFHLISYNPNKRGIDYNVAYECGFILRLYENPPEERFAFAAKNSGRQAIYRSLTGNKKIRKMGLAEPAIRQFAEQLYSGLMTQLRSVPIGLRIDSWIRNTYPSLREAQKASIAKQQQDNVQALTSEIKAAIPTTVFAANAAMNAAYALFSDNLLGTELYIVPYRSAGFENSGERLVEILNEIPEDASHDRDLVDAWAEELELQEWYEWIPIASEE